MLTSSSLFYGYHQNNCTIHEPYVVSLKTVIRIIAACIPLLRVTTDKKPLCLKLSVFCKETLSVTLKLLNCYFAKTVIKGFRGRKSWIIMLKNIWLLNSEMKVN